MDAGSGRSKTTLKAGDFMPFEQEEILAEHAASISNKAIRLCAFRSAASKSRPQSPPRKVRSSQPYCRTLYEA